MHIGRNLVSGGLGGLIRGAEIGLLEAVFHLSTSGAPDLWSPVYGIVLYALIGLPFGVAGGVAASVVEFVLRKSKWKLEPLLPFLAGEIAATVPMLGFILYYLANKVVYLEQGVPMSGKLGILGILAVLAIVNLLGGMAFKKQLKPLLKPMVPIGLVMAASVVALVIALLPLQADPREQFAAGKTAPSALSDAPDVLFIMVDTLRADHVNPELTPTLASVGDDGIVFEQAFAQASWTRSSGASLWTSRLPSGHNADTKASRLSEDAVLWSETLQDAGVTTGALVNNINLTGSFGFDQGFDTFLYESPEYRFAATESVFALTFYKVVHKVAEKVLGGTKAVAQYYQPADVVLADAQAFIEANDQAPWALYVHLMEPHDPYFEHPVLSDPNGDAFNGVGFARAEVEHPDPADADYLRRVYADEVRWLDQEISPFIEWLKASDRYDNTVIVLTADHGEEFYEHGGWWHGTTLYDEQIHVPLIVKPAGAELAGTVIPWQVRNIDVAPTLAAAMGVAPDASWQGEDLIQGVRDYQRAEAEYEAARQQAWQDEQSALLGVDEDVEADTGEAAVDGEEPARRAPPADIPPDTRLEDPCFTWPYDRLVVAEEDFEGNVIGAVRTQGMKLIRANQGNPRGLPTESIYWVATDPGETDDLAGTAGSICERYMDDWASRLGETLAAEVLGARSGAVVGEEATMTLAECQRLEALGYVDNCDHL